MPVELTFADDGLGVLLIGKDVVEGRDIVDIKEGLVGEIERLGGRPYWLVDFTEVNELRMSGDHMARLIEIDNEIAATIPNLIVALAAASDSVYGFARMWEIKAEKIGWTTAAFRDADDAKHWIRSRLPATKQTSLEKSSVNL